MYTNEFEAIYLNRKRDSDFERREVWRLEDVRTEDEGVRRRFDAFIASLGRDVEHSGPTQASDLL